MNGHGGKTHGPRIGVASLERSIRRLTYVLIAAAILAGAGAVRVLAPRPPTVLRAGQFVAGRPGGRERAVLGLAEDSPQLLLYDRAGFLPRVALFAGPRGTSGLTLSDRVGGRASLTAGDDGGASLALVADGQTSGGSIALAPAGDVAVRAWSEGGSVTMAAPAEGAAHVEARDAAGKVAGRLPRPFPIAPARPVEEPKRADPRPDPTEDR